MKSRRSERNPLLEYFEGNPDRLIHKWMHYFDIYHRHFAPWRGRPVTVVEFGVFHGGSLQMWKHYFGRQARIIGVDIEPRCKEMEERQVEILIGDQEDREFLRSVRTHVGPVDIVIDDGGHTMAQQIATFEELYPAVVDGGVYLVEDLHTSYWEEYGGGYGLPGTFIEYAKGIVDQLNAHHSRDPERHPVTALTRTVGGMHVYDSIIVFDKAAVPEPTVRKVGRPSFPDDVTWR
jgi:hypothetical protein